jgi:signal transduction histidine kinase
MDFSRHPMSGSDVAAVVFGALALIFFVLWFRDRERGTPWLAVGYSLLAVQYANDARFIPTTEFMNGPATALHALAGMAVARGLLQYLADPAQFSSRVMALAVTPLLLVAVAVMLGVPLPRPWGMLPFMVTTLVLLYASIKAARAEPSAGHEAIAVGLASLPLLLVALLWGGLDSFYVRYYAIIPEMSFGLILLTVSLVRRRRALEQENERRIEAERALTVLNASLEQTVSQRTADLQNIVAGLESFNRNVSHDLRGSLGGMSGLARAADEALHRDDVSVARRVLPLIAAQAEQSAALVSALLTLARVGDHDVHKAATDLNALAKEAIAAVTLNNPAARLPHFIVGELPPVHADASLLRPALTNLISNAVKFCGYRPDGCVELLASADTRETIIQVRDNGVGFRHDCAPVLFEPFVRLHGPEFNGHGVGLSIVRRAIERQGGRVWAEAAPEKGASFFFALPNRIDDTPQASVSGD